MADQIPDNAKMDAVDILKTYADFIRNDVRADDFERHPYLPHIEQTIEDLRAAPPAMDREADIALLRKFSDDHRPRPGLTLRSGSFRVEEGLLDALDRILSTLSADAIRQGEGEGAGKKLMSLSRFMGEQAERENVVAWLRARGDSKPHGTDWRAYYEAADAIEVGSHEPATPASHASDGGKA